MEKNIFTPPPASLPSGSPVVAYVRSSSNNEDDLIHQKQIIVDYCAKYGLALKKIYADIASGNGTKHRKQFQKMLKSLMSGNDDEHPHGLLLLSYSRFSRRLEDLQIMDDLRLKGVEVYSLTESHLKPFGAIIDSLEQRCRKYRALEDKGERQKAQKNLALPPIGYVATKENIDDGSKGKAGTSVKWKANPKLVPQVRRVWELRAQGIEIDEICKATNL